MRKRILSTLGVAGLLLVQCGLSGCTSVSLSSNVIEGIRSDPDHQGLVVSYVGGLCDGSARLVINETPTRIDATVIVRLRRSDCPGVGIPSTVAARLGRPIGDRTIWAGGRQQIPFDGARLLVPSLPADYTGLSETGSSVGSGSTPADVGVTTTWDTTRFVLRPNTKPDSCEPRPSSVQIRLGPATSDRFHPEARIRSVAIGSATANLYRIGRSKKASGWAYVWTVDEHSIELTTGTSCDGDQLLSPAELLHIAESLRPA